MSNTKATRSEEEESFSKLEIQELSYSKLFVVQEESCSRLALQESMASPHWFDQHLIACAACKSHNCVCFETALDLNKSLDSLHSSQELNNMSLNLSQICKLNSSFTEEKEDDGKSNKVTFDEKETKKDKKKKKKSRRKVKALRIPKATRSDKSPKEAEQTNNHFSFLDDSYGPNWLAKHTLGCKTCGSDICVCFETIADGGVDLEKSRRMLEKSLNLSKSFNFNYIYEKEMKAARSKFQQAYGDQPAEINFQDSYSPNWLAMNTLGCKSCNSHVCICVADDGVVDLDKSRMLEKSLNLSKSFNFTTFYAKELKANRAKFQQAHGEQPEIAFQDSYSPNWLSRNTTGFKSCNCQVCICFETLAEAGVDLEKSSQTLENSLNLSNKSINFSSFCEKEAEARRAMFQGEAHDEPELD